MGAFLTWRLIHAVFVVWGVVTVIFIVMRLVPGDPATLLLGTSGTPAQIAALRHQLGLDQSPLVQYVRYLDGAVHLDFGTSYLSGQSAASLVGQRAGASAHLALVAAALSIAAGVPLGLLAARNAGRFADKLISTGSTVAQALPNFWLGIVMILIFSRDLKLVPSAGNQTWDSVVMPAVTLALPFIGIIVRLMRGDLIEVMHQGYVQTARAKGLSEATVLRAHAVRNALIPVVTVVGVEIGALLGGAVVVESVFAWPGVGRLLVDSIDNRDFSVVQAAVAFIAVVFVVVNLLVDVAYGLLDPRIRMGTS
jgi:ABC-type dipeptide/oligopeptide/nickel transport system permease component